MAEKKIHDICGREVAHTAAGEPYRHNCRPRPVMVRCGTCDTDVPAREDGSVSFHHIPGSVDVTCDGADTVGRVTPRDPEVTEATEDCETCGREGVPVLAGGALEEHLLPEIPGQNTVPPVCDASPGGPAESAGPAPFGGDPATEVGGTRNRPLAEANVSTATSEDDNPDECSEKRDHCCRTPQSDGSVTCDHCGTKTTPARLVGWGSHLTEEQRAIAENGPTHPLAELVVHPAPNFLGQAAAGAQADKTAAAMAFLEGGPVGAGAPAVMSRDADAAMAFLEAEEVVPLNVSGQPRERTNRSGYLITDPATGEFRRYQNGNVQGFTRCTTLIKATSDNDALRRWNLRNVVIGAVRRPDVVAKAFGLTHEDDRERLDDIVEALEDIAGAKIAAQAGTDVHEVTERLDGGQLALVDVPPYWRALMAEYRRKLGEFGLEPVPGLIERTTYTAQYGGVAGTFDRALYHRASRTYVMSDVKTGQGALTYGRREIPAQLAIYTDGANENGVYDWNTDTWHPLEHRIRTDWGLIIHMPLQGAQAHTVELYPAPLAYGREVAAECAAVRAARSNAPKFAPLSQGFLGEVDWESEFSSVNSPKEASLLFQEARAANVPAARRQGLVLLAQQRLREVDSAR